MQRAGRPIIMAGSPDNLDSPRPWAVFDSDYGQWNIRQTGNQWVSLIQIIYLATKCSRIDPESGTSCPWKLDLCWAIVDKWRNNAVVQTWSPLNGIAFSMAWNHFAWSQIELKLPEGCGPLGVMDNGDKMWIIGNGLARLIHYLEKILQQWGKTEPVVLLHLRPSQQSSKVQPVHNALSAGYARTVLTPALT